MTEYPSDLPLSEIKTVISIIRTGEITLRKNEFAHDLWVIQGYAQSKIIGSGGPISSQAAEDEDPIALLEKVVAANEITTQGLKDVAKDVLSTIDWATVLQWAIKILIAHLLK